MELTSKFEVFMEIWSLPTNLKFSWKFGACQRTFRFHVMQFASALNISVQKTELVTVEEDTTVYIGFIGQIYVTKNLTYIVASALAVIDSVLCENSD